MVPKTHLFCSPLKTVLRGNSARLQMRVLLRRPKQFQNRTTPADLRSSLRRRSVTASPGGDGTRRVRCGSRHDSDPTPVPSVVIPIVARGRVRKVWEAQGRGCPLRLALQVGPKALAAVDGLGGGRLGSPLLQRLLAHVAGQLGKCGFILLVKIH